MGIFILIGIIGETVDKCGEPDHVIPDPFYKTHMDEYIDIPNLTHATEEPYITGKVITINITEKKLDDILNKLPSELRAKNHDEVGMVVWLEWGRTLVGTYTGGAKGYAHTCNVTLINFVNNTIIDEQYFRGTDPPEIKVVGGDAYGSMPTQDIVDYIKGLPQKLVR